MNKIQTTIYITAKNMNCENNKINVLEGDFYFQGKKYEIKNGEIITNTDKIPF